MSCTTRAKLNSLNFAPFTRSHYLASFTKNFKSTMQRPSMNALPSFADGLRGNPESIYFGGTELADFREPFVHQTP